MSSNSKTVDTVCGSDCEVDDIIYDNDSECEVDDIIYDYDSDSDIESESSENKPENNDEYNAIINVVNKKSLSTDQHKEIMKLCQKKIDEISEEVYIKNIKKKISKINIDKIIALSTRYETHKFSREELSLHKQNIKHFIDGIIVTRAFMIESDGFGGSYASKSYYLYFQFEKHNVELEYEIEYEADFETNTSCKIRIPQKNRKSKNNKVSDLISILKLNINEKTVCEIFDTIYRGFDGDDFEHYLSWIDADHQTGSASHTRHLLTKF